MEDLNVLHFPGFKAETKYPKSSQSTKNFQTGSKVRYSVLIMHVTRTVRIATQESYII